MNFVIFLRNVGGILSEFHGYSQKMMKCLELLIKSARKMREKAENSGLGDKFHSFISLFQSSPYERIARSKARRVAASEELRLVDSSADVLSTFSCVDLRP